MHALHLASDLLAQAGGGSSGFSGGGGGGGGGGGSASGGGGGYSGVPSGEGDSSILWVLVVPLIGVLFIASSLVRYWAGERWRRARRRSRTERRAREVATALVEAAAEDPAFEPDRVRARAVELVERTQEAWDARDLEALAELVGDDLLEEWRLRLKGFDRLNQHSRITLQETPSIELVGLVNRTADEDDRLTFHVTVATHTWADSRRGRVFRDGHDGPDFVLSQYWTLGRRDGEWILLSIEEDGEGDHHLRSEIVATPHADSAIADRARTELAAADAAPAADVAAIAPELSSGARATALDLALADDRFSPDVLTAAVRRAVEAWREAVDGDDAALEALATPEAVGRLLYADDGQDVRTVVRGPRVGEVLIERIDGGTTPPRAAVLVRHRARWYREERSTQKVVTGSRERETAREERWTLALDEDPDVVWRLVDG